MLVTHSRGRFPLRSIGLALYATVVIIASFGHHDLACHLKNPQHCTACTATPPGTGPDASAAPGVGQLSDAGRAASFQLPAEGVVLPHASTGRSPPVSL